MKNKNPEQLATSYIQDAILIVQLMTVLVGLLVIFAAIVVKAEKVNESPHPCHKQTQKP